jgi:hypothetical protein
LLAAGCVGAAAGAAGWAGAVGFDALTGAEADCDAA